MQNENGKWLCKAKKYFRIVTLYKTGCVLYGIYNPPRAKVEGDGPMRTSERRMELIRRLYVRKHDTMANLAFEFDVSVRTIQRDLDYLSGLYPIYLLRGGHGGGVYIEQNHFPRRAFFTKEEQAFLVKISQTLSGRDLEIVEGMLLNFAHA